jgi:hypothetical protein
MTDCQAEIRVEGSADVQQQMEDFRCCPLGVQFYSRRELPLYRVMQMDLQLPDGTGEEKAFTATGIVVQSQFHASRREHRVWIMFTDLPDSAAARLKCVSKETGVQCPHCMNY